ncbi:hypothetical protein K438DRAFT_1783245 [Mycena galopus ATCC 62051]|nr:hypothetical protein K438DRAFT_1783245 [Mycena galopus ATCC 62051]
MSTNLEHCFSDSHTLPLARYAGNHLLSSLSLRFRTPGGLAPHACSNFPLGLSMSSGSIPRNVRQFPSSDTATNEKVSCSAGKRRLPFLIIYYCDSLEMCGPRCQLSRNFPSLSGSKGGSDAARRYRDSCTVHKRRETRGDAIGHGFLNGCLLNGNAVCDVRVLSSKDAALIPQPQSPIAMLPQLPEALSQGRSRSYQLSWPGRAYAVVAHLQSKKWTSRRIKHGLKLAQWEPPRSSASIHNLTSHATLPNDQTIGPEDTTTLSTAVPFGERTWAVPFQH